MKKYLVVRIRTLKLAEFVEGEGETYNDAIEDTQGKASAEIRVLSDTNTTCTAIERLEKADEEWKHRQVRLLGFRL